MIDRRTLIAATGVALALPAAALASAGTISAQEANTRMQAGELILIDVRTPPEWQQTGVAQGAWMLDMTHRNFGGWLMAALERNPNRQIAIICRTGNRTGRLIEVLKENGIEGVLDVTEGMVGGPRGTGWIPAGLPVVSAQQAFEAMPKDLTAAN